MHSMHIVTLRDTDLNDLPDGTWQALLPLVEEAAHHKSALFNSIFAHEWHAHGG